MEGCEGSPTDRRDGAAAARRIRILYVEDQQVVARAVVRMLRRRGIDAVWSATLADADRTLRAARKGFFDAALLDIMLSDGTGTSLLPLLRERAVPVLVLSGHCSEWAPLLVSWRIAGVPKGDRCDTLAATIRALLDRRRELDRRFAASHGLSRREVEMIACATHGMSASATARKVGCRPSTVIEYWKRIFAKMRLRDRAAAIVAYRNFHDT